MKCKGCMARDGEIGRLVREREIMLDRIMSMVGHNFMSPELMIPDTEVPLETEQGEHATLSTTESLTPDELLERKALELEKEGLLHRPKQ